MRLKTPLWRRTPPAIFPVCLGFLGLGLAWRNAATVFSLPTWIGDLLIGVATAYFIFFLLLYLLKLAARPLVLLEDLEIATARAGVSALPMSLMLLAAALLPFGVLVVQIWWAGVALQVLVMVLAANAITTGPIEARHFSPFMYLTFVGLVVAPIAGIPLGYLRLSQGLGFFALGTFVVITVGYGLRLLRVKPPVPLRPSMAIILAPISLLAMTFVQQEQEMAFLVFYYFAWIIAVMLLVLSRWMMTGGWTPNWGAFTFPIAAFSNLQVMAINRNLGILPEIALFGGLAIGTPLILYIVYRATRAFLTGELAKKSAAATA
ncbi:MAG: hypothetical protein KDA67_05175 [Rhodobacteraceae bacterium]|nr:hypothetical protein [Paracoccaceae bacterium]